MRIEQMERERSQNMLETERFKSEIALLNDKVRSFEEDLRIKATELEAAQNDISQYREQNGSLEM